MNFPAEHLRGLRAFFPCSVLGVSKEETKVLTTSRYQQLLEHFGDESSSRGSEIGGGWVSVSPRFQLSTGTPSPRTSSFGSYQKVIVLFQLLESRGPLSSQTCGKDSLPSLLLWRYFGKPLSKFCGSAFPPMFWILAASFCWWRGKV